MFRSTRRVRLATVVAGLSAAILLAAGCSTNSGAPTGSSSTSGTSGSKITGGTVTFAMPAATTINYIFPFMSITTSSVYNSNQFQYLLYRQLYMFGGNNNSVTVNYSLSPANPPVYTDGGKTVTFALKGWKWSNGETVDGADVVFWLNMLEAEKANYYGYSPGLLPDNLVSYSASGNTVTMHLNKAYSDLWFTYNQLAEVTPFPMAWDVTSLGATPGSGGCTTDSAADKWAKCIAVYKFLTGQAANEKTYASSPLWSVVNGPFRLSSFNSDGYVTIVPNPKYSGSPKPTIGALEYVPFTTDATEYTALRTGSIDVASIDWADLPQKPASQTLPSANPLGSTYNLEPFYYFGIDYVQLNFNGPDGAIFKQLYVRQALQELIDQPAMVTAIWRGYAYPTAGPVPNEPASQWLPSAETANGDQGTYPFSISGAKTLLTSHGWQDVGGVMTCETPSACGAGISKGTPLKFSIWYTTGMSEFDSEMAVYKSDASEIGVQVSIVGQSFDTVIGESSPCSPGPKCNWDGLMYGGWVFNGPGYEPTGEPLFQTGAGSNSGSYTNPAEDSLISLTHTSSSISDFYNYATYTMQQAPYLWLPTYYYVEGVSSTLHNVAFNPLYTLTPEFWYFTK
jgi:peptide/nickel transport system substrate-binding protein